MLKVERAETQVVVTQRCIRERNSDGARHAHGYLGGDGCRCARAGHSTLFCSMSIHYCRSNYTSTMVNRNPLRTCTEYTAYTRAPGIYRNVPVPLQVYTPTVVWYIGIRSTARYSLFLCGDGHTIQYRIGIAGMAACIVWAHN